MSVGQALNFATLDGGFFDKQNLKVQLLNSKTGSAAVQAVISGDADFASANLETALNSTAQGRKLFVPLRLLSGQPGSLVVSKAFVERSGVSPDAPVDQRLKALSGATLASQSPDTSYTALLKNSLGGLGLQPDLTFIASETMPAVLANGQIDGFVASSPFTDQSVSRGDGIVWINGPKGEWPGTTADDFIVPLVVSEQKVQDDPELVTRVIAAYLAASNFVKTQPDAARDLVAKRFPDQDAALFNTIWQSNQDEFVKPIPTAADIARSQSTITGDFAQKVQAIDPSTMLLPDLVNKAESMAGLTHS